MAIESKNILYKLTIDRDQAIKDLKAVDKQVKNIEGSSKKAAQTERGIAKTAEEASKRRIKNIKDSEKALKRLRKERKKAFDPDKVREFDEAIRKTSRDIDTLKGKTKTAGKGMNNFGGILAKVGGVLSATFAVERVASFISESVKLANQTKNVRNAFDQLKNSAEILRTLKEATSGTVGEFKLLQVAVRADKFNVPLGQLSTLFKFATDRAAETGQEVDYLVNSIVDGIGRKSALVLDNLGLSAADIQAEFKKTGDFGQAAANIIEKAMKETNVIVDEGALAAARLSASYEDLQIQVGDTFAPAANTAAQNIARTLTTIRRTLLRINDVDAFKEEQLVSYGNTIDGVIKELTKFEGKLDDLNERGASQFDNFRVIVNDRIRELQLRLAQLREDAIATFTGSLNSVGDFEKAIADTNTELSQAVAIFGENGDVVVSLRKRLELLRGEYKLFRDNINESTAALKDQSDAIDEISKVSVDAALKAQNELAVILLENAFLEKKLQTESADEILELEKQFQADKLDLQVKGLEARLALLPIESKAAADLYNQILNLQDKFLKTLKTNIEDAGPFTIPIESITDAPGSDGSLQGSLDERLKEYASYAQSVNGINQSINEYQNRLAEQELSNLQLQFDKKLITEQQFAAKTSEIKRDQAKKDKQAALFSAIINTAAAVTEALPIIPLAVLAGIQGAAQVALIASQPIPQFAEGVIGLKGDGTGTSDSIPAMLSAGESVMTAKETIQHKDMFDSIRNGSFDDFAKHNIIDPALMGKQVSNFKSEEKRERYDDYRLRLAVKDNKSVGIRNTDALGKSVAKHIGSSLKIKSRYV